MARESPRSNIIRKALSTLSGLSSLVTLWPLGRNTLAWFKARGSNPNEDLFAISLWLIVFSLLAFIAVILWNNFHLESSRRTLTVLSATAIVGLAVFGTTYLRADNARQQLVIAFLYDDRLSNPPLAYQFAKIGFDDYWKEINPRPAVLESVPVDTKTGEWQSPPKGKVIGALSMLEDSGGFLKAASSAPIRKSGFFVSLTPLFLPAQAVNDLVIGSVAITVERQCQVLVQEAVERREPQESSLSNLAIVYVHGSGVLPALDSCISAAFDSGLFPTLVPLKQPSSEALRGVDWLRFSYVLGIVDPATSDDLVNFLQSANFDGLVLLLSSGVNPPNSLGESSLTVLKIEGEHHGGWLQAELRTRLDRTPTALEVNSYYGGILAAGAVMSDEGRIESGDSGRRFFLAVKTVEEKIGQRLDIAFTKENSVAVGVKVERL